VSETEIPRSESSGLSRLLTPKEEVLLLTGVASPWGGGTLVVIVALNGRHRKMEDCGPGRKGRWGGPLVSWSH